jgi:pimeloyl-ACP methyl ester carboxylesterase
MRRLFLDSPIGQLHVREHSDSGIPLLMLHAAPGSALMLSRLQEKFHQRTLAIDLPGMGDSAPLPSSTAEPTIADYTDAIIGALNTANIGEVDVYGTLSGVRIALEMATRQGSKIRRVVLDGIGIPKPEQLPELLEQYAPHFTPDINGNHLLNTFQLCRDQYLFYPWYARDAEHRRPNGLPSAEALHVKTMESLKSASAFRPLIRAAFRYDVEAKLKALTQPALISADGSVMRPDLSVLEFPPVEPLTCPEDLLEKRATRIAGYLEA